MMPVNPDHTTKIKRLTEVIRKETRSAVRLMEVCGGHTLAVQRFGIRSLIPEQIELLSGPGCPVCVTSTGFIDDAIEISEIPGVILATFGDLMRVPGSDGSLEEHRRDGTDIRIVLSPIEALQMAMENPDKEIVFLGIGFETTAPGVAASILRAYNHQLNNFSVLSAHKIMPPALQALVSLQPQLNGFICPGHVSTITGSGIYQFIAENHRLPCVIAGFEALDILQSVHMLIRQFNEGIATVEIQYARAVTPLGNQKAQALMHQVFEVQPAWWRGLGILPASGLQIRQEYSHYSANARFNPSQHEPVEPPGCKCGEILSGHALPSDCPLFANTCSPDHPVGACMVSSEGACQVFFRYQTIS